MKIFGIEIGGKKKEPKQLEMEFVQDEVPEVQTVIPQMKKPTTIPRIKDPSLLYHGTRARGRGQFQPPEYNLSEIGRVEDTDGYVRQSFDKKTALMFKEDWDIVGPDPKTIKYIKIRFAQIARASGIPTKQLFRLVGSSLVRKSNAFLVKVRKEEASGGRIRREPGKTAPLQPVAGYFIVPAETMEFQLSGHKIVKWKQKMPNGIFKYWDPKDVVHIHYDRKDGFVFGTPTIVPVIDDIRALRKIEENIELLVYQHLFPLFQYKVGTENAPAGITESGEDEIDVVRREIMFMPTEGGIVTPERHEIKAIGAEGRAIRAEGYLEHFKKRVFSGLGVSAVDMGEGETANRATADNMSRNLIDAVKDFQQVMEIFVNEYIINELLLESTFGPSVLDEDRRCWLKFKEIDIDAQIKKEAHNADQFAKDIITWDEARIKNGYEPITIPTRQEMDSETDTAEKYPQWHKTRWKVFEEPQLLIQSLDEPFSPTAKAVARNQSLETTSKDLDEAGKAKQDQEVALEKERTKAKVAVAKAKPRVGATRPSAPKRKDGFLADTYTMVMKDIVERVNEQENIDHDWVAQLVRAQMNPTIDKLVADQIIAFRKGYRMKSDVDTQHFTRNIAIARQLLRERAEQYVTRLTEHTVNALRRNVDNNMSKQDLVAKTRAVFDSFKYRTEFIEDVEIRKARNLGMVFASRQDADPTVTGYSKTTTAEPCERCQTRDGQLIPLGFITLDDIPPYHANCHCTFSIGEAQVRGVQDGKIDEPGDYVPGDDFHECPKCGKTAIRKKDTPDIFNCRACKTSFRVEKPTVSKVPEDQDEMPGPVSQMDEETEESLGPTSKQTKFTKCVLKAKARLRSQHPDWDEGKIEMLAEAACDHLLQQSDDIENEESEDLEIEDVAKMERCVLKVKQRLRKEHPDWDSDKVKSSAYAICTAQLKGK